MTEGMGGAEFVLDRAENPHPDMLALALTLRSRSRWWRPFCRYEWRGYLRAMAAATGCSCADLEEWMDRHA